MFRTVAHDPYRIKACQSNSTVWIAAYDQKESSPTDSGGKITIFLSPAQAVALRDQFNAMNLKES